MTFSLCRNFVNKAGCSFFSFFFKGGGGGWLKKLLILGSYLRALSNDFYLLLTHVPIKFIEPMM